jgi:hypothetical protein
MPDGPVTVKPRRVIKSATLRLRLGGISRSTEHRWRTEKPGFPRYIPSLGGYDEDAADQFIATEIEKGSR